MAAHVNSHALPFLPGQTFTDPTKSRYHLSQTLDFKNGYGVPKKPQVGVGGDPLHVSPLNEQDLDALANFKPTLTYGQAKQAPPEDFIPSHVAFDKKVLQFMGYFKQTVYESQQEYYRVRPVKIYYYLEDDTIAVIEPQIENSGMPQGKLLKRQRLPKDDISGQFYTFKDIKINDQVTFYGKVFHITDCDKWTREYLTSEGLVVNNPVPVPNDPYVEDRKRRNAPKTFQTPSDFDKLKQFLTLDRKVLRFFCVWDDRENLFGESRPLILHYYLVDDSVEIREVHPPNDGRDPFPLLLCRTKMPKNIYDIPPSFPTISMEPKETEYKAYFSPEDFMIGKTVMIMNRRIIVYDMDQFTKEFYRYNYGVNDFTPVNVAPPARDVPQMVIPPYNGFGSLEDSFQSCLSLVPEPPRKDFIKMLGNAHKDLRFLAVMDDNRPEPSPEEKALERKFIVIYSLATDTITIHEPPIRNSGMRGGKYVERTKIPKPGCDINHPEFYGPQDLYIGSVISVFNQRFKIIDADDFVLNYLQDPENRRHFPHVDKTLASLQELKERHLLGKQMPSMEGFTSLQGSEEERAALVKQVGEQLRRAHHNRFFNLKDGYLKLDASRQRNIPREELQRYVKNINLPLSEALVDAVYDYIDEDKNGEINFAEFITFIEDSRE